MTAKTKNNIVELIYTSETYNTIIKQCIFKSGVPNDSFEDIRNDMCLIILNHIPKISPRTKKIPPSLVERFNTNDNDAFRYWFVDVTKKQIQSVKSKTYSIYVKKQQFNDEFIDVDHSPRNDGEIKSIEKLDKKIKFEYVQSVINAHIEKSSINKRMLTCYKYYFIDDMTYDAISTKTLIPLPSVFNYVKAAKIFLAKEIPENLFRDRENN